MKNQNTWLWWVFGSVALLGVGVGTYIYIKQRKSERGDDSKSTSTTDNTTGTTTVYGNNTTSSSSQISLPDTPFKNRTEGDAFRQWVNERYPAYAKEIDLDPSNSRFNNINIKKAWAKYGSEYQQSSSQQSFKALDEIYGNFYDGLKFTQLTKEPNKNRVRGKIIDSQNSDVKDIYMNIYTDNTFEFQDGNMMNRKVGKWSGTYGNITLEVGAARRSGKGSQAAFDMAKYLYPSSLSFNGQDSENKDIDNLLNDSKIGFVDSQDAIM